MKICIACLTYGSQLPGEPEEYLASVPIFRELPQRLAALGHEVVVVHQFPRDAELDKGGVRYLFVSSPRRSQWLGKLFGALSGRDGGFFEPARRTINAIATTNCDVIHFHGTVLTRKLSALYRALGTKAPPVVAHFHGGWFSNRPWLRRRQVRSLRRVARICVTTRQQGESFVAAGAAQPSQIATLVETSSTFTRHERADSRAESAMYGDPILVCAGRLEDIKDPMTVLRGFERIAAARPSARLYLYYLSSGLLPSMKRFLSERPALDSRVSFEGRVRRHQLEQVFNSADFLLQASLREHSGLAVLDAMACGTIPVVTDIDSFQVLTAAGRFGLLFPPGDDEALAAAVLSVPKREIEARSLAVRRHFEAELSFAAMATRLEAIYGEILRETGQPFGGANR